MDGSRNDSTWHIRLVQKRHYCLCPNLFEMLALGIQPPMWWGSLSHKQRSYMGVWSIAPAISKTKASINQETCKWISLQLIIVPSLLFGPNETGWSQNKLSLPNPVQIANIFILQITIIIILSHYFTDGLLYNNR